MRWIFITAGASAALALAACSGGHSQPATGVTAESLLETAAAGNHAPQPTVPVTNNPYTLFETLQVRPLAVSADGGLLFAANTPDNRLEVFNVAGRHAVDVGSVVVGL